MAVAVAKDNAPRLFDPARLDRADTQVRSEPFRFLVARDQLPAESASALREDFPKYASAGFFPYAEADCGPSVNRLVADLTDPAVATAVGARLGIDNLGQYPTLVTLCRSLNKRHGTIHTDSRSKVATA
ncbi:MAG TPA: 2OG-Fe(II) oxygenase, partial [Rudaea sp.]